MSFDAMLDQLTEARPVVEAMSNNIGGSGRLVLDHGFVRLIDYMGDDAAIVQAARVSYGAGTKTVREDQGLINYLMRNGHTSPFEMCEIKLHCKMPIFVARQWVRHRTASINEYSMRYSEACDDFYVPEVFKVQDTKNKQGSTDPVPEEVATALQAKYLNSCKYAFDVYKALIDKGVSREQARMVLPLSTYTEWYWKIDLHNLLHFLELRLDQHAQWEIRQYAKAIAELVELWVPMTYQAWIEYRMAQVD